MILIGNRIRQAREQAGLTQARLADLIGVGRTAIARWENGDIEPKLKNLIALANQLHVSTDYLLGVEAKSLFDQLELSETASGNVGSAMRSYGIWIFRIPLIPRIAAGLESSVNGHMTGVTTGTRSAGCL